MFAGIPLIWHKESKSLHEEAAAGTFVKFPKGGRKPPPAKLVKVRVKGGGGDEAPPARLASSEALGEASRHPTRRVEATGSQIPARCLMNRKEAGSETKRSERVWVTIGSLPVRARPGRPSNGAAGWGAAGELLIG